eukprot:UN01437
MIHFLLLQNRQGKTRMSRYFSSFEHDEKQQLESEVHKIITTRDKKCTNFVEFRNYKLVYRRYASLFFSFCLDINDNELLYLETIHLFVELLDKFFESVCELDLVFHFHKVYGLIDEMFLAGEVQESSKRVILDRIAELDMKIDK